MDVRALALALLVVAACGTDRRRTLGTPRPTGRDGGVRAVADAGLTDGGFPAGRDAGFAARDAGFRDAGFRDGGHQVRWVPVTIDFDDILDREVSDQYAESAIFSTTGGAAVLIRTAGRNDTDPNFICSDTRCRADLFVDFTRPVRDLRFTGVEVNNTGDVAMMVIHHEGGTASEPLVGDGTSVPLIVDLSAYVSVTRLEVVMITEATGIGFDTFVFERAD